MAGYIEGLGPDATIGMMFDNLYGQVEAVIGELNEQRLEANAPNNTQADVPGTPMRFNWVSGGGISTYLSVHDGWEHVNLLGISNVKREGTAETIRDRVYGWRGNELTGDYKVGKGRLGLLECRLGRLGVWRSKREITNEPTLGVLQADPAEKLKKFRGEYREHLTVVAKGILDNLAVVKLLQTGADPAEALATIDRAWVLERR